MQLSDLSHIPKIAPKYTYYIDIYNTYMYYEYRLIVRNVINIVYIYI